MLCNPGNFLFSGVCHPTPFRKHLLFEYFGKYYVLDTHFLTQGSHDYKHYSHEYDNTHQNNYIATMSGKRKKKEAKRNAFAMQRARNAERREGIMRTRQDRLLKVAEREYVY